MSDTRRERITKRAVDGLALGEQLWDAELRGFGVRRQKGRPYYFVSYRAAGRRRWITLGPHGPLTPESARKEALKVLGDVARGGDPAAHRDSDRAAGNVENLAARFLKDYAAQHNKKSSAREYERLARLHIVPALGSLRINDVTPADIDRWHANFKTNPVAGNRALALLKHMFNLAERWGLRTLTNPARQIDMFPERPRERLITAAELARLGTALENAQSNNTEHPSVVACIKLLILTGARLSEVLKLKWEHVDFERSVLRLPDSKTGAKTIPLGAPALKVLSGLFERKQGDFVCPGHRPDTHFVGIQRPWRRIRNTAGLPDLRIHDLRHGFASMAAMSGDSLFLIGKILGHKQSSTTERYAHLQDDPVRAVADRTAQKLSAALEASESSSVVQLKSVR